MKRGRDYFRVFVFHGVRKRLKRFFFFGGKKKHFSLDEKKKALFFFCVGFLVRRTCSHDFFDILAVFLRWGQPRRQDF